MNIDHLVTMANQIGTFFASFPDREEAHAGIATHLERYWAPRMRVKLYEHVDSTRGLGLDPIVLSAIAVQRGLHELPVAENTSVPKDEDTGGDAG
ncbi:formate dehydrogenase subunit delta [Massilia sp. YIM B02763]|uniref:formate dehydrogenase subunit delta n=1 Tax=Massilia sp. YIM B02763 TaxID=3050130 RepID=UPI0025B6D522|nr:formate dehydrogenase subunit delta [Massilia sp. YIM B02763]MDN4055412.1 formate dehydrogenase subunit delta [Massilia sp. YIM B02763]